MKQLIFFALGLVAACSVIDLKKANQNSTLFLIEQDSVSVDEFLYAFNKNRPKDSVVSKAEVDEYLELYKKFKLKVAEALALGMDTTSEFKKEYSTYMSQLENSYLQSSNDTDSLVLEAYDRLQYEISASHILLLVDESAIAEDTLLAYNKSLKIRDSIVNLGKDFDEMAIKYSEDPSAKENRGDLGYFGAFQMIYPFESAAYNTAIGEVTMPVRTRFGYHLIMIKDKRPNEGKVRVAHIMIRGTQGAEDKAYNLYNQLINGADWNQLCAANSDDQQSSARGGELTPFSKSQIVAPFAEAAFSLTTPNEISEPIQTPYGWHIIKLLERLPIDSFNKMQEQLRSQVRRDTRSQVSKQKMLKRLAEENNLVENQDQIQGIIDPENHLYEETKFVFDNDSLSQSVLFTIRDEVYLAKNLFEFIERNTRHQNSREFLYNQYQEFKNESLTDYEKAHLGEKYEEYVYLKQEYFDGILLFSIMEDKVWDMASTDSVGIINYYNQHKEEFSDSTTVEIAIFKSSEKNKIDSIAASITSKDEFLSLSGIEKEELASNNNDTTTLSLRLEYGEIEFASHELLSNLSVPAVPMVVEKEGTWFYLIPLRLPEQARRLANVRGRIIAEYQNELEKNWIAELEVKYPITIDNKSLDYVYKRLDSQ